MSKEKRSDPVSVRLSPEIAEKLRELAKKDKRTQSSEIEYLVELGLQVYERREALIRAAEESEKGDCEGDHCGEPPNLSSQAG